MRKSGKSFLNIDFPYGSLRMVLDVELPRTERRTRLLAICDRIRPVMEGIWPRQHISLWHEDSESKPIQGSLSLREALKVDTPDQARGFDLRIERLKSGLSQEDLAKRARIDRASISQIERGQRRPRKATIERLKAALASEHGSKNGCSETRTSDANPSGDSPSEEQTQQKRNISPERPPHPMESQYSPDPRTEMKTPSPIHG
jgi:transcriptional regulator with XRE-family HTH domain